MKFLLGILFLFVLDFGTSEVTIQKYYEILEKGNLEQVNKGLTGALTSAKKGALLMKKASLVKKAGEKLKVFKEGKTLLEAEINKFPKNIEYRFLRLIIQENCPKFLKYNSNIVEDKKIVTNGYIKSSLPLKNIIKNYLDKSKSK